MTSVLMGIFLGFLMICPLSQGAAVMVWSESFDTADEWELRGFDFLSMRAGEDNLAWNPDYSPSVKDGKLQMPNTQEEWHSSQAVHNSTVAYGTWSFDWYVNAGEDHQAYDVVLFIANNYILTEQSGEIPLNMTGYGLVLNSGDKGETKPHSVSLAEWRDETIKWIILDYYQFPSTLEGPYHIDTTRNITGEFSIFFDGKLKLQVRDNSTTTSENFIFNSWLGDSTYDNLNVSDTIEVHPSPNGADYPPLFLVVVPIGVLIILRKKRKR